VHSHFTPFLLPSLLSFPTSALTHFSPPFPFPKEVNKKLSYRELNALSEHILYLFVCLSRLAGSIMFSTCPSVRPSVRSSVANL